MKKLATQKYAKYRKVAYFNYATKGEPGVNKGASFYCIIFVVAMNPCFRGCSPNISFIHLHFFDNLFIIRNIVNSHYNVLKWSRIPLKQ